MNSLDTIPKDGTRFVIFVKSPYRDAVIPEEAYWCKHLSRLVFNGWATTDHIYDGWCPLPKYNSNMVYLEKSKKYEE